MNTRLLEGRYRFREVHGAMGLGVFHSPRTLARAGRRVDGWWLMVDGARGLFLNQDMLTKGLVTRVKLTWDSSEVVILSVRPALHAMLCSLPGVEHASPRRWPLPPRSSTQWVDSTRKAPLPPLHWFYTLGMRVRGHTYSHHHISDVKPLDTCINWQSAQNLTA